MPRKKARKKYPKLPSGFGSIRYLGSGRRNCYAVHPPSDGLTLNGSPNRPPALCYVDDWIKGFTILTAYKAGTYEPGMEKHLDIENSNNLESLAVRIMADYSTIKGVKIVEPISQKKHFVKFMKIFTNGSLKKMLLNPTLNQVYMLCAVLSKTLLFSTIKF